MLLSENIKISSAITSANGVAGTTDIISAVLDMSGFDSVLMCIRFGVITSGAVTSIKAQQGTAANGSDLADLAGSGQTIADTDDDKLFFIDLHRPSKRYVALYVDRGTQNAVVASAIFIQYNACDLPVPAQGSNVSGEAFVTPAEGSA